MKKIFLFCLMLNLVAYADNIEILSTSTVLNNSTNNTVTVKEPAQNTYINTALSNSESTVQNNYTNNTLSDNENIIKNVLSDIIFSKNEFIKIQGKINQNGKLSDFEILQSNLNRQKEQDILQKLMFVQNINSSYQYDKFNLYLFSKPDYSMDRTPYADFVLTSDIIESSIQNNKKQIKNYFLDNYYNKIHTKWVILNQKQQIKNQISLLSQIDKTGNLLSLNIAKSSGNKAIDDEVIKLIKSSMPFSKFDAENITQLPIMFDFNKNINIEEKVKSNFTNTTTKNFEAIVKTELDKNGNVLSSEIVKSTENKEIDDQILLSVQKTRNFFETINYDDNAPYVRYILFKQAMVEGKPVLRIDYFALGNEPKASQLELIEYGNLIDFLVKKNWIPPMERTPYSITALFIMDKNGHVTKSTIIKSSNIPQADAIVLRAINTATLPAIPDSFNSDFIPIEMTFDYELDPNINPILKDLYFSKDKK